MAQKRNAPVALGKRAGAYRQIKHEGKEYFLNNSECRVYSLLTEDGMCSTVDIAERLHLHDPRSVIRYLRAMGIPISDMWCQGEFGVRFKRYFIKR